MNGRGQVGESRETQRTSVREPEGEIALLFSGGLDTTLEAVERLKQYQAAHLVTFDNGCCINLSGAARRAGELAARFGAGRVPHSIVNTAPLLRRLLAEHATLPAKSGSPLVFDLACKMAGIAALVSYAERRGVKAVSDGAAREQTQIFVQHPEFSAHIAPFMTRHGLRLVPPVHFDMGRDEKMRMLKQQGFRSGPAMLEKLHVTSQILHQPFCMRGILTYFFTSPLRNLAPVRRHALPMAEAKALWDAMLPCAEAYMREAGAWAGGGRA